MTKMEIVEWLKENRESFNYFEESLKEIIEFDEKDDVCTCRDLCPVTTFDAVKISWGDLHIYYAPEFKRYFLYGWEP